jgi:hypothetical protein
MAIEMRRLSMSWVERTVGRLLRFCQKQHLVVVGAPSCDPERFEFQTEMAGIRVGTRYQDERWTVEYDAFVKQTDKEPAP